jgi:subtilase family serine protease
VIRRLSLLCALAALAAPLPATAAAPPVALTGSVPGWAVPAARVGDVAGSEVVQLQVVLPRRGDADAFARAVSDPAGPAYGGYLTPAAFRARFAPSATTVATVTAWLESAGLEVGAVPANRMVVPARGSARAVGTAFGTTFGRYAVSGLALRAPDHAPLVPPNVARLVAGVRGLDEGAALIRTGEDPPPPVPQEPATPADVAPPAAVVYGAPCGAFDGAVVPKGLPRYGGRPVPAVACATSPQAVQAAYGVTPLLKKKVDGTGQTVVMVGSHAIKPLPSDVDTWSKRHGLPGLRAGQLRQVSYPGAYQTPSDPTGSVLRPSVWAVQAATLFETAHTVAPGADLVYVGTTSSFDLATGTLLAVDGAWGNAVINGWYTTSENVPDAEWTLIDQIAAQAAATGISLLFAAGDLGDGAYTGAAPSTVYPASEPMATAVGATSLILGRGGKYVRELAWGKSTWQLEGKTWSEDLPATYRGTGGGTSTKHPQPAYQKGVVPASLAERPNGALGRTVPDLAVLGDAETGMAIGYTQTFPDGSRKYAERRVASSTASTALVAGLLVLANDRRGTPIGFANPLLYGTWRKHRTAFRDIVRYGRQGAGVRVDYVDGATAKSGRRYVLKAFEALGENVPRRGYDTAAGLGTPAPSLLSLL